MNGKFLALVGSPRVGSTSGHFADHLVKALADRGWEARSLTVCSAIRRPNLWSDLEAAYRGANVVGVVAPLYVDSLPAELTLALERLAVSPRPEGPAPAAKLFAVLNCGFAESHQNDLAVEMCRLFAREAGLHWMGGLAIGGGGMYGGSPLEAQKGRARNVIAALDGVVEAVSRGEDVPESAKAQARVLPVPEWAYFTVANIGMALGAAKNGALHKVAARPNGVKNL